VTVYCGIHSLFSKLSVPGFAAIWEIGTIHFMGVYDEYGMGLTGTDQGKVGVLSWYQRWA
jgi:hypothetical protein